MKVICIYMLHDLLDTVASASCFRLSLTENFRPRLRPHTFWPRPWPHPSLASLTSLVGRVLHPTKEPVTNHEVSHHLYFITGIFP